MDEFPDFGTPDVMPWDLGPAAVTWLWGADMGRLLTDISSKELLRKRKWLERDTEAFAELIQAIDDVLTERGGEL